MACLSADGKPTEMGISMLSALNKGLTSPDEIAKDTGLPLFRVRSGLRNLTEAGYVTAQGEGYKISEKGSEALNN